MNRPPTDLLKKWAPVGVASACFVFSAIQTTAWYSVQTKQWALKKELMANQHGAAGRSPAAAGMDDRQSAISDLAKQAGVRRLIGVGSSNTGGEAKLQVEWESRLDSTLAFLQKLTSSGTVGPAERLTLGGSDRGPSGVHVTATFSTENLEPQAGFPAKAKEVPARDVFTALWRPKETENSFATVTADMKRLEEAQKKEQERQEADRLAREETEKWEAKRRDLQSNFILTGIVNNGQEALAFVSPRNGSGALMIHDGDTLGDARVTRIDENRGELHLDCQGRFEVVLKINSANGGSNQ